MLSPMDAGPPRHLEPPLSRRASLARLAGARAPLAPGACAPRRDEVYAELLPYQTYLVFGKP
jgi:hypothetical protein